MTENNIKNEIISIISEVSGVEEEQITLESHLANDLEIDSIKAIEIIVAIEKKYKISIRDEDVSQITSVHQIFNLVDTLTRQKASP